MPGDDDGQADRDSEAQQLQRAVLVEAADDRRQLQAEEQEHERVDHPDDGVHTPTPIRRASGLSTRAARRPAMTPAVTTARTPETPDDVGGQVRADRRDEA